MVPIRASESHEQARFEVQFVIRSHESAKLSELADCFKGVCVAEQGDRPIDSRINGGPDDTNRFQGDGPATSFQSLDIGMNPTTNNRDLSYIDVKIEFLQGPSTKVGVQGVSFSIFDVDRWHTNFVSESGPRPRPRGMQWEDVIHQIQAFDGSTQYNAPGNTTITAGNRVEIEDGSSTNPRYHGHLTGPELSNITAQDDNPGSVVGINWNPGLVVDTVSFRYSSGSDAVPDPGTMWIGLSDITFYSAVPEAGTMMTGALLSLTAGIWLIRKRKIRSA